MLTRYKVIALILANLVLGAVVYDLVTHLWVNWKAMIVLIATQRPSDEIIDFMSMGFKMAGFCTLLVSGAFTYLFAWSMAHFALWHSHYKRDREAAERLYEVTAP